MLSAGFDLNLESIENIIRNVCPHQNEGKELAMGYTEFLTVMLDSTLQQKPESIL